MDHSEPETLELCGVPSVTRMLSDVDQNNLESLEVILCSV